MRVLGVPVGNGRVRVESTGTVEFAAAANLNLVGGALTITASVSGFMQPSPFAFNIEGQGRICIVVLGCGGVQGIVSSKGVSGCADANIFGFIPVSFSGFFEFRTKKFESGFGCGFGERARVRRTRGRAAAAGTVNFDVPRRSRQYVAHIKGRGKPPKVRVTSPSGRVIASSRSGSRPAASDRRTYIIFENRDTNETSVFLGRNATPGVWKVQALPGSRLTGTVFEQEAERKPTRVKATPSALASATTTPPALRKRAVDLTYALKRGQTVTVEVTGDKFQQTLATGLRGRACPKGRRIAGRSRAETRCQRITYTPGFGYAGKRDVVALILDRDGAVINTIKVASYRAANPPLPTTPPDVRVVRRGTDVFIVWGTSKFGVTRYAVYAQLSDGRKIGFTSPAKCQTWKLSGVDPATSVVARVQAGRKDLELGGSSSATLKSNAAYGGPAKLAKAKIPPTCAPIP